MDAKWGIGPEQARAKHPELIELGQRAGASGPGPPEELARAQHTAEQQARKWRSSKASERFDTNSDVWLKSLMLLTLYEPTLENLIYLCAAAYDWRGERSLTGLAASAWAFGDFLQGKAGKALITACVEDEAQRERLQARYAILVKDFKANLDLGQLRPKAEEGELIAESLLAAERLEELLNTLLVPPPPSPSGEAGKGESADAAQAPMFTGMASFLRLAQERSRARGGESEAGEPAAESRAAAEPPATPPAASGRLEWRSWVTQTATELRGQQRQNPFAYILLRAAWWAEQFSRPLRLTAPAAEEFKQLEQHLREGQAAQCLDLCEKLFLQHPVALDLSYYCARALELLDCMQARDAMSYLTFMLLEQYPTLLTQRDGPELRPDTRGWLQQEQLRWGKQVGAGNVALPADDVIGALTLLQRGMMQTRSRSRHFQLRMEMARYCLDQGRANLATPILELLTEEAETFRLADWDPELLTTLLLLEERAAMAQADPASVQRRVRARLCQLDPVLGARLDASQS